MSRRPWSLARRLTGTYVASLALFAILLSATSATFLRQSIEADLNEIAEEELREFQRQYLASDRSQAELERIAQRSGDQYKRIAIGWRLVESETGRVRFLSQADELWSHIDNDRAPGVRPEDMPTNLTFGSAVIESGETVEILFRSTRWRLFDRFIVFVSLRVIASLVIVLLIGRLIFGRVSALLQGVARQARSVRESDVHVAFEVDDAPVEIREVQAALSEMLDNIRRETEQARLFTAGLAHELRSPVQNLIGETEVALIAERDPATYREVMNSHLEELRSLGDAVDNLVTICSARQNQQSPVREHFDLAREAAFRLQREKSSAVRHGRCLNFEARGDTALYADREAILRALRNLTANALQWTAPNTCVDVVLDGTGSEVVVTVDDAGPGVPEELRERVFEPFFRGPAAAGQRVGYGLGLALTRAAMVGHGGRIEISTSPAGGARFRMFLPRRARAEHQDVA